MTIKINSKNLNKKRRTDLLKTEKVAKLVLKELGEDGVELNIIFLSNQRIRALNRAYLSVDTATDVIAFPSRGQISRSLWVKARRTKDAREFLGDIAISSDKAAQNAAFYGTTFMEEIALYVIHGTLHLMGYKDITKKARVRIQRKENEFLQKAKKFL
ncbi:MAG: rRNA maturation RNase YbeY [Candidatus Omnitrophota bacterium]